MMKAFLVLLCLVLTCSHATKTVNADLILDSFQAMNWDRLGEPGNSSLATFRVTSDQVSPTANQLNAFSVGLRFVAQAGATGSLAVHSVVLPDSSPVFTAYAAPPALNNVGGGLQTISGDNAAFVNVTVPDSGLGLFRARFFSPSNDALGLFHVYADRDTTSYFTTTEFDGLKFANVQSLGSPPGVLLGSITVTAVPEPTSVSLVSAALLTWVAARRRRRKCPT